MQPYTKRSIASLWLEMRENCGNDCPSMNIIQKKKKKRFNILPIPLLLLFLDPQVSTTCHLELFF